jgi:CysZ protein
VRLRLWDGVRAFFGGCGFIITTPRVWGYAMVPVVVATMIGSIIGVLGMWASWHAASALFGGDSGAAEAGRWIIAVLLGIVAVLVALIVALSLAQPFSGFAIDAIVRRQEQALGSKGAWPDQKFSEQLFRSLRVNLTALAIGLPIIAVLFGIEILAPPAAVVTIPLKFVVTALMVAWDFLDYPLGLRGAGVSARLAFVGKHFWAVLVFGSLGAFVLLVPGLGLFLLPMGAAGATRMVLESERA